MARQQVPRQVAQSGLNAVLVAPQFAVDALDSTAGQFREPGALPPLSWRRRPSSWPGSTATAAPPAIDALPVVIVAYSGGYYPAAWVMRQGGLGDRLRGVIMLDGLYGDLDKFAEWIAGREAAFFFSAYSRSSREENADFQKLLTERGIDFAHGLPAKLAPGSVTFVGSAEEVVHRDFVTNAWVEDPLKVVLARIAGYPRTPPPKPIRRR